MVRGGGVILLQQRIFSSWRAALSFVVLCFSGVVHAGVFSVSPVRIYMSPGDKAVAVTVVNEGDSDIVLQADIFSWTQDANAEDALVLSDDMILSPPILKLAPQSRQVVRLALLRAPDPQRQLTYRLILREIPEALGPPPPGVSVPVALALSMPVFITPPAAKRDLSCSVTRFKQEESLNVYCLNHGTAYAQLREVTVSQGKQRLAHFEGGSYVLPDVRHKWNLPLEHVPEAGAVSLVLLFDDGLSQKLELPLQDER
jgi:fimbrial chaperone protein